MTTFKVTVGIRPVVKYGLGSSMANTLPDHLVLGDLNLRRSSKEERHTASLEVQAETGDAALNLAVGRAREALVVLATLGDAYHIELWPMPTIEAPSAPPTVTETAGGTAAAFDALTPLTGHLGVVVRRSDYSRQAAAVASSSAWPVWLRTALELNYLGETAGENRPALILHWSALEVVVHGRQGNPKSLAKAVLGRESASQLRDELISWLQGHALNEAQARRMTEQAMKVHLDGTVERFRRTLHELNVPVEITELKNASRARGSVVHAQDQPSDEDVRQSLERVRAWLRATLSVLLDNHSSSWHSTN